MALRPHPRSFYRWNSRKPAGRIRHPRTPSPTQEKTIMQYKTIVLELIQEQPELYEQLREQDAAAGDGRLRDRAEGQPRGVEGPAQPGEAGQRPEPDRSEALELAIAGPAGPFALRVAERTKRSRFPSTRR